MSEDMALKEVYDSMNDSQHHMMYYLVGYARSTGRNYIAGVGRLDNAKQRELREIYSTLDENQKLLVDLLVRKAIEERKKLKGQGYEKRYFSNDYSLY